MNKWLVIALWSVAVCVSGFFMLVAFRTSDSKSCAAINIEITGNGNDHFVTEEEIRHIVSDAGVTEKMPVAGINIRALEEKLERNPWIRNAELFIDKKSVLNIRVYENVPVLRVFDIKGNNYYLDGSGTVMPSVTGYTGKLPVFTGWNPQDTLFTGQILLLAQFINKDPFWQAQVQQVDITKDKLFNITPSLGDEVIYFGDTSLMEDKFNRLYQYYTQVAPKSGLSRFASLNVQFAGQLVAVNKNTSPVVIDSANAGRMVRSLLEQNQDMSDTGRIIDITPPKPPDTATSGRPVTAAQPVTPPKPVARAVVTQPRNNNAVRSAPPKPQPPKPQPPKPATRQPRAVMRPH